MPFVLESTAFNIGYVFGQAIGVLILLAIPAGIAYGIYRVVRKKPAETPTQPAVDYGLEPMMLDRLESGPCPGCGSQAQPQEVYCGNCGRQLRPIL